MAFEDLEQLMDLGDLKDIHDLFIHMAQASPGIHLAQVLANLDQSRDPRTVNKGHLGKIDNDLGIALLKDRLEGLLELVGAFHIKLPIKDNKLDIIDLF